MGRNLKNEDAATYHKIQESKVNSLWVGKGENLGRFKAFFLTKQVTSPHFSPALRRVSIKLIFYSLKT